MSVSTTLSTTTETTSTARYRVVVLATTLAMITYLDRTAIGTLAPGIRRDLGLSASLHDVIDIHYRLLCLCA